MSDTLILCGECRTVHEPSLPPSWEYEDTNIVGSCVECGYEMIRVPRGLSPDE